MQGKIFNCADDAEREEGMNIAVKAAQSGRLVVMPTDTLYGLGCDAFDNDAVANLLATKQRGPDMPVPVSPRFHGRDGACGTTMDRPPGQKASTKSRAVSV